MRRKGVHMRHLFWLSIVAMILSGCALPLPLQVAGWVLDGFSMVTTDKTLADHGISMAAGQDYSIWRGLTEGDVCVDERGNTVMTAMAGHRSPALTLVRVRQSKWHLWPRLLATRRLPLPILWCIEAAGGSRPVSYHQMKLLPDQARRWRPLAGTSSSNSSASWFIIVPPSSSASTMVTALR